MSYAAVRLRLGRGAGGDLRHPLPILSAERQHQAGYPPYLQGETWDPITCADGAQQTLGALLYESLYTLGTDFLPQPCLAESASYDAESYALTVTVRSGVTFSDGSTLTAWDVVAALRRAKESVRYGQRLAEMDSVSYLGESTLPLCQGRERGVSGPANGLVAG